MSSTSDPSSTSSASTPTSSSGPSALTVYGLYLYVFVGGVTLIIFLTSVLVLRGYLTRRETRRRIAEAIRNGTYVDPNAMKFDPEKKPIMKEIYLGPTDGQGWGGIMPISVTSTSDSPSSPKSPLRPFLLQAPPSAHVRDSGRAFTNARIRSFLQNVGLRRREPTLPVHSPLSPRFPVQSPRSPAKSLPNGATSPPSSANPESVRVAVLIAMPSQTPLSTILEKNKSSHETEDDLPHFEMGVSDVMIPDDVPSDVDANDGELEDDRTVETHGVGAR